MVGSVGRATGGVAGVAFVSVCGGLGMGCDCSTGSAGVLACAVRFSQGAGGGEGGSCATAIVEDTASTVVSNVSGKCLDVMSPPSMSVTSRRSARVRTQISTVGLS